VKWEEEKKDQSSKFKASLGITAEKKEREKGEGLGKASVITWLSDVSKKRGEEGPFKQMLSSSAVPEKGGEREGGVRGKNAAAGEEKKILDHSPFSALMTPRTVNKERGGRGETINHTLSPPDKKKEGGPWRFFLVQVR